MLAKKPSDRRGLLTILPQLDGVVVAVIGRRLPGADAIAVLAPR
jgi:hypothetical protein